MAEKPREGVSRKRPVFSERERALVELLQLHLRPRVTAEQFNKVLKAVGDYGADQFGRGFSEGIGRKE